MSLHNLIANGGKVLIVGGKPRNWQEYRNHPQLEFWSGEAGDILSVVKGKNGVPSNVKVVITSRFIPHSVEDLIRPEIKKRKLLYMPVKNDGEISRILDEITMTEKTEVKTETTVTPAQANILVKKAKSGVIKLLIEKYDDVKLPIYKSAERIFNIIQEQKLETATTINSLGVTISKMRRDAGIKVREMKPKTKVVKIEKPEKTSLQILLNAFDDAIAGLQLAREAAVQISKENDELKTYKEKVSKILDGLK